MIKDEKSFQNVFTNGNYFQIMKLYFLSKKVLSGQNEKSATNLNEEQLRDPIILQR
jgi:hypothetical protein